jgi:hypothetical protein
MSAFDPKADIGSPRLRAWPWIFDLNQVHHLALQTIVNGAPGGKFAGRRNDHVSETADGGHVISCLAENAAALSPSCYAAFGCGSSPIKGQAFRCQRKLRLRGKMTKAQFAAPVSHVAVHSIAIWVAMSLAACEQNNQYAPPPPPKVTVATPVEREIPRYFETTGNAAAVNSVDLVARVQGFLQAISYTDGDFVKKGTSLFTIEPQPYKLKVDAAKASVISAQATLMQAQAEYERQAALVGKQVATQANYDKALAQRDSAQADLQSARANQ